MDGTQKITGTGYVYMIYKNIKIMKRLFYLLFFAFVISSCNTTYCIVQKSTYKSQSHYTYESHDKKFEKTLYLEDSVLHSIGDCFKIKKNGDVVWIK